MMFFSFMKSTGSCKRLRCCPSPTPPASFASRCPGWPSRVLRGAAGRCSPERTRQPTIPSLSPSCRTARPSRAGGTARVPPGEGLSVAGGAVGAWWRSLLGPGVRRGGNGGRHPGPEHPGFCHRGCRARSVEGDFQDRMGNDFANRLSFLAAFRS